MQHKDIEALARSLFGAQCQVITWQLQGDNTLTTIISATLDFPSRMVVLKLADSDSPYPPFAREAAIQQRVARETAASVCEVLAVDDSCQRFPWRYFMMAHAPGLRWSDGLKRMTPQARRDIFRQLGEATAALHRLRYPHFGEVGEYSSDSLLLRGEGSGVRSNHYLSALVARARRRIANPAHAGLFEEVVRAHAGDFATITEPRLTHEDLNPSNLLAVPGEYGDDDWHLSAVLDFGSAWAGCPESDIARLELWRDMMGDGFRDGYTAHQPLAEGYTTRRPTPIHHADTARVCAELGIPPVTFR